tara:strand:+ start:402 stop:626 length:225 start_codon:yes stop_codon:yes gene_type:complete
MHDLVGNSSLFIGLGVVSYGIITQDIETIAGGAAMGYIGKCLSDSTWNNARAQADLDRNRILRDNKSSDKDPSK